MRRATRAVVLAAACSAVGLGFTATRSELGARVDRRLAAFLARPRGRAVDRVAGTVTDLGSVYGVAGLAAALAAAGRPRAAGRVAAGGAAGWIAAQGAKELVDRPRPYESGGADRLVSIPAGSSFPSGHSATAAGMAAALAPDLPTGGQAGALGLLGVVAASRVYVGVHHASDVVAGSGLGAAVGLLAAAAVDRLSPAR